MTVRLALCAATATLMTAGAANAQVVPTFADGVGALSPGEVAFATFNSGDNGGVAGSYLIQSGSNSSGADPAVGDQGDPYLSVLGGQSASFDFTGFAGGGLSQLGLDYGSADAYNTFILLLTGGGSMSFTGQDLINIGTANGDQASPRTNGRLTFNADPGVAITGLVLSSSSNSLETDNYGAIAAVPEPSTWATMLAGFAMIGFSIRKRQRGPLLQIA